MKWVKKVDKGGPKNLRADGMLLDFWEDLKAQGKLEAFIYPLFN